MLGPRGSHLIRGLEECKSEQLFEAHCCKSVAALNSQVKGRGGGSWYTVCVLIVFFTL